MELTHLLDQHNIPYYTNEFGHRYKKDKHIRRGWIGMVCPFCGTDHLWLGYRRDGRYFYCWNHGYTDPYKLFREWFPNEHTSTLLNACGIFRTGGTFASVPSIPQEHITPGIFKPPNPIYPLSASLPHQEYLASRGLDWRTLAERYALGAINYASEHKYNHRIFIPIHNITGTPISWQTRSILPNAVIPYIAAPKTGEAAPIKSLLYGMNYVTHYDTIIVVEGAADMWRINLSGNNHAVATLGKDLSPAQLRLISQYAVRIFCFDNETKAQQQAKGYCKQLSVYPGSTHNICLDAPDPATASRQEIDSLLRFAFG